MINLLIHVTLEMLIGLFKVGLIIGIALSFVYFLVKFAEILINYRI